MSGWWVTALGVAAGLLTTGSFVPQVVKAWREGDTAALSLRMYLVMTGAFALWLGYGLVIGSRPVIVFNVCNLALGAAILWLKLRERQRRRRRPGARSQVTTTCGAAPGGATGRQGKRGATSGLVRARLGGVGVRRAGRRDGRERSTKG